MDSLFSSLHGLISYAMPMIILLGLLIFVHELGHFLVAKYYKVRVEVFSLGFGPKLFKFKRGDTVYAISAIPLGGYVKMFGDDPTAPVADDQKQFAFNHKPVFQRIAIVLAGPLMNLFFAAVLFTGVAAIGEQALLAKLGDIKPDSPAYAAGFRSGDTIVAIDSNPVKSWDDLQKAIEKNADRTLNFVVQREGSGAEETLQATPKLVRNKNVLSWDREVGEIEGLTPSSRASLIAVQSPDSIAGAAGMQTGDVVRSINGVSVSRWRELLAALEQTSADTLTVEIERGLLAERPEPVKVTVSIPVPKVVQNRSAEEKMAALGLESPELYLASIEKGSPAEAAGLQQGDRLIAINGKPLESFEQVSSTIRSFGEANAVNGEQAAPLSLLISRNGQEMTIQVAPNMRERMSPDGREVRRFEIGIRPMIVDAPPAFFEVSYSNPIAAAQRGMVQTWRWTSLTVLSFVRLFQAEVSPKNIGGFLSIGQMAKNSWQVGLTQFLSVMAIISINLFILNLLPVPVLDGGHLVFYTIEALRGAPLSMRKMEIAQQVGLFLLLALMVFALFNDVTRLFN